MLSRNLNLKFSGRLANRQQQLKVGVAATRTLATQAEPKVNKENETTADSLENARPYSELPGPSKFEFVRGVMPGGPFYKKPVTDMTKAWTKKYGKIFRMPGLFGSPDIVVLSNPVEYPVLFRNEGQWPYRRSFDSMVYYREVYRRDFFDGVEGIIQTQGEKWAKMRKVVNPILMLPQNAKLYLNKMQQVNNEFLARIREIRDPATHEVPDTFEDDINRLTFESVASVALNTQLGLIRKNREAEESKNQLRSLRTILDLAFELDIKPSIWKYIKTPKFYKLMKTLDSMTDFCAKYIDEALTKIEKDNQCKWTIVAGKEKSVVEKLARIDKRLAVVMALDMMMAGVDTTSTSLIGILFGIAKNPEKQQKLLEEVRTILPHKDSRLTNESMRNLPYLRACIKEGIRMYPIIPGTMRRMPHDIELGGYRIPKGTDVTNSGNAQLTDEEFVPRAKEFIPERWLRQEDGGTQLSGEIENPFMYLPFGFGPRSCAGKRIVNLELEITVSRLVRNFNIEFNYSIENAFSSQFIVVPNIPLKFKFEERNE